VYHILGEKNTFVKRSSLVVKFRLFTPNGATLLSVKFLLKAQTCLKHSDQHFKFWLIFSHFFLTNFHTFKQQCSSTIKAVSGSTFCSNEMQHKIQLNASELSHLALPTCSYGYDPFGLGKKPGDFAK